MVRGFYSATSGMLTNNHKIDVKANNIANVSTAGYKSDTLTATVFNEALASRIEDGSNPVGPLSTRTIAGVIGTDMSQGNINQTQSPLDLAIQGNGLFTYQSQDGQQWFSRDGHLSMDAEGYLALDKGGRLMGSNGAIQVNNTGFTVNGNGQVYNSEGEYLHTLLIYQPAGNTMVKQGDGMFVDMNYNQGNFINNASVVQGSLEGSNVNMTRELTEMIASQRSFQACSQALKMIDSTLQKAVNDVGRA